MLNLSIKDSRYDTENYRPVQILQNLSRRIERGNHNQIYVDFD